MAARDLIRQLYRHMEWADAAVWAATPDRASRAPDARLRDLLIHLHLTQRAFFLVWTGQAFAFPDPASFDTLDDVRAWARPYYRDVEAYLDGLDDASLEVPVVLPWSARLDARLGRPPAASSLADTLLQVPSHTTYHRGQVNARLRELGHEPPLVDYIAWIWFGRPGPAWP